MLSTSTIKKFLYSVALVQCMLQPASGASADNPGENPYKNVGGGLRSRLAKLQQQCTQKKTPKEIEALQNQLAIHQRSLQQLTDGAKIANEKNYKSKFEFISPKALLFLGAAEEPGKLTDALSDLSTVLTLPTETEAFEGSAFKAALEKDFLNAQTFFNEAIKPLVNLIEKKWGSIAESCVLKQEQLEEYYELIKQEEPLKNEWEKLLKVEEDWHTACENLGKSQQDFLDILEKSGNTRALSLFNYMATLEILIKSSERNINMGEFLSETEGKRNSEDISNEAFHFLYQLYEKYNATFTTLDKAISDLGYEELSKAYNPWRENGLLEEEARMLFYRSTLLRNSLHQERVNIHIIKHDYIPTSETALRILQDNQSNLKKLKIEMDNATSSLQGGLDSTNLESSMAQLCSKNQSIQQLRKILQNISKYEEKKHHFPPSFLRVNEIMLDFYKDDPSPYSMLQKERLEKDIADYYSLELMEKEAEESQKYADKPLSAESDTDSDTETFSHEYEEKWNAFSKLKHNRFLDMLNQHKVPQELFVDKIKRIEKEIDQQRRSLNPDLALIVQLDKKLDDVWNIAHSICKLLPYTIDGISLDSTQQKVLANIVRIEEKLDHETNLDPDLIDQLNEKLRTLKDENQWIEDVESPWEREVEEGLQERETINDVEHDNFEDLLKFFINKVESTGLTPFAQKISELVQLGTALQSQQSPINEKANALLDIIKTVSPNDPKLSDTKLEIEAVLESFATGKASDALIARLTQEQEAVKKIEKELNL